MNKNCRIVQSWRICVSDCSDTKPDSDSGWILERLDESLICNRKDLTRFFD